MLYDVYNLGPNWQNPDPLEVLRDGPCVADMRLTRRFPAVADSTLEARFYQPGTRDEVMRRLISAKVQAVGRDSMMIVGQVIIAERQTVKSKTNAFTVGYLCKPPGTPVTVTPKQIARSKARREERSASGFDERDDNIDAIAARLSQTTRGPLDESIS